MTIDSVRPGYFNRMLTYDEVEEAKADDLPEMQ